MAAQLDIPLLLSCGHSASVDRSLVQAFYSETVINCALGCDSKINVFLVIDESPGQDMIIKES